MEINEVFVVRLYPLIHLPRMIINEVYFRKKEDNIQQLLLEGFLNNRPSLNQY
jgi:hypothetical protein